MNSDGDSDNYEDLLDAEDAHKHSRLVEKVLSLNKTQNLKKPSRTEPTLQISEFDLVKSITGNAGSVDITQLTRSLKDKRKLVKINENLKRVNRSQTLPKPLEKPLADRIRRSVAYEKVRLDLDKWEAVVTSNRVSNNLSFPLESETKLEIKKQKDNFATMWRIKSALEQELEKIEPKVEEYTIGLEEKEEFPLTMKEMMARRKEAAKLRAFQGYKEAKARRQNKIKSKKYHRIQKKMKIKRKLKEFEALQKTDPEAALQKLEEIEKARVEERMSLRHKSTGKWARDKQIRAKYDKSTRQELAKQLNIAKELTQKLKTNNESESEEEDGALEAVKVDESNPWLNGPAPDKEMTDFVDNYRKFWTEKNKKELENGESGGKAVEKELVLEKAPKKSKKTKKKNQEKPKSQQKAEEAEKEAIQVEKEEKPAKNSKKNPKLNDSHSTSEWDVSVVDNSNSIEELFNKAEKKLTKKLSHSAKLIQKEMKRKNPSPKKSNNQEKKAKITLEMKSQKNRPIIDEELNETPFKNTENDTNSVSNLGKIASAASRQQEKAENIDPNKYLNVKTTFLSTAQPDLLTEDSESSQKQLIIEAFEDDDLVEDFNKTKQAEVDKDKPKDIDLTLPGWGSWGGANIKPSSRKKKRFIIKAPENVPRRDDNKGSLIINENVGSKIKEHLVSEIPFPFKTVKDFEASIRAPIGNTFVPEKAFRKYIKPDVTTRMGTIIEPMSRDLLLRS